MKSTDAPSTAHARLNAVVPTIIYSRMSDVRRDALRLSDYQDKLTSDASTRLADYDAVRIRLNGLAAVTHIQFSPLAGVDSLLSRISLIRENNLRLARTASQEITIRAMEAAGQHFSTCCQAAAKFIDGQFVRAFTSDDRTVVSITIPSEKPTWVGDGARIIIEKSRSGLSCGVATLSLDVFPVALTAYPWRTKTELISYVTSFLAE